MKISSFATLAAEPEYVQYPGKPLKSRLTPRAACTQQLTLLKQEEARACSFCLLPFYDVLMFYFLSLSLCAPLIM